ncbi:hypothetical protein Bpla01_38770 [Burkholderia plantarii]|nr:hypothetical protein Bpla01_38770 [Burkholderia plantarii]
MRAAVPVRLTELPFGPLTLAECVQVPAPQSVEPLRVVVPRGPVSAPDDEYWPAPFRVTLPLVLTEWPSGPVTLPVCVQVPPPQLVSPPCA